jgi:hypothetical protein
MKAALQTCGHSNPFARYAPDKSRGRSGLSRDKSTFGDEVPPWAQCGYIAGWAGTGAAYEQSSSATLPNSGVDSKQRDAAFSCRHQGV